VDGRLVSVSDDGSGTTCGAWLLDAWGREAGAGAAPVQAWNPGGWRAYREAWRVKAQAA
jgi:hypothetical protein